MMVPVFRPFAVHFMHEMPVSGSRPGWPNVGSSREKMDGHGDVVPMDDVGFVTFFSPGFIVTSFFPWESGVNFLQRVVFPSPEACEICRHGSMLL